MKFIFFTFCSFVVDCSSSLTNAKSASRLLHLGPNFALVRYVMAVSFDQDSLGSPSLYHFEQQWQFIRISNDADKRESSDLSLILFCLLHP